MTEEIANFPDAERFIQTNYVDKVLAFLNGTSDRVTNNSDYMKVYNLMLYQCDQEDNNNHLYNYFERIINSYIVDHLIPFTKGKQGEQMLEAFVKCWQNFSMFSKLMEKMFDYLNRYYLKNQCLPQLGEKCMSYYKDIYYDRQKNELRTAVLLQITKDRKGQVINRETVKKALQCYVDMGLVQPRPMKSGNEFVWQGDKNLTVYDQEFEEPYLNHTK